MTDIVAIAEWISEHSLHLHDHYQVDMDSERPPHVWFYRLGDADVVRIAEESVGGWVRNSPLFEGWQCEVVTSEGVSFLVHATFLRALPLGRERVLGVGDLVP